MEEATVVSHAVFEEVIVEGEGGHVLDIGGVVAGATGLDWGTFGAASTASPVECGLQRGVVGVVLGHAPELRRAALAFDRGMLGLRRAAENQDNEEKESEIDRHW